MDANGDVLARQGDRTVAGFKKSQRALTVLSKHDKPGVSKDRLVTAAVYIARLELGKFDLAEATATARGLDLDQKQKSIYDREITNLEVADLYAKARKSRDYSALGARFVKMKQAGKVATGSWSRSFWSQIMNHAQTRRDAKQYEEAYARYKAILGNDKRYQRLFERYDSVLEALENGEPIPKPPRRPAVRIQRAGGVKKN